MEAAISCHPALAQEPGQPAGRGSRTPGLGSRCVNQPSRPRDADLAVNLCFPISAFSPHHLMPSFKAEEIPFPNKVMH